MIDLNQYIIELIRFNFKEHEKNRIDEIMNPDHYETNNLEIYKFTKSNEGLYIHCVKGNLDIIKYICENSTD